MAMVCLVFGWQATSYGLFPDGSLNLEEQNHQQEAEQERDLSEEIDMDLFWTVWEEVENKYVDEDAIEEDGMVYGAIKGMVNSLDDDYTAFMTPEESEEFSASLEGTLEGIGAELTIEDGNLMVVSPLRDSPAERAGILPKDIIYLIDDEPANEMTIFEAIMNIRGEKGTTVVLTILRDGMDDPLEISIVRDSIDLESVTVEKLENGIVYLSVNQFNDKTNEEFGKAVSEMLLDEPTGVIIDLRFNGGGYLDIAVELLSYVLPSDSDAVEIRQRNNEEDEMMKTNGNPKILEVPLIVLVNEGSASASEIFAGAVQDYERGMVMGTQTFGKGTVQEVETFRDGSSIRMTIARWFTPNGRSVDKSGLTPDIVVELTEEDMESEYDRQKEEAIKYLEGL